MNILHTLENDYLRLCVSSNGAAIHQLFYKSGNFHILRQGDFKSADGSSLFPMAPMANRIKGNRFLFGKKDICLPNNKFDDFYFLHGDAWIRKWKIEQEQARMNTLTLTMKSKIHRCYIYKATMTYKLQDKSLISTLSMTNLSNEPFLFGGGFHPFFNTIRGTKVQFNAEGIWLEGDNYLPTKYLTKIPEPYNFNNLRAIPDIWINNGYVNSKGCNISILHPNGINVIIMSAMKYIQVYQPNSISGFICIEPQSHWVGAHHHIEYDSLVCLNANESMEVEMVINVE